MNITLVRQPHDQKIHVQIERLDSHAFEVATIQPADDDPIFREADRRVFGARLFEALFPSQSPTRHAFDALAPNSSICLITDDADLQAIPWEYMRDARQAGTDSGFVLLKHIFVRGVGDAPAATQPATTNRLRVLAVISDPLVYVNDTPVVGLNIGRERETLRQAFTASQTPHHVTFVKPATLRALHNQLAGESHAVLHFIGHGVATPSGARLLFEHPSGVAHEVSANEVIAPARGRVSLVFLNACESATTMQSPVSNLAREWVVAGVPHAIGMQFKVPEVVALRLSETFYRYLAQSNTVQASLHQARRALWADDALQRMPTTDGGTLDYRPFALGIAVLYEGARAPATAPAPAYAPSTSDAQPSRIDDPQPRADFDPTIPDSQTFRGRAADMARLGRLLEHGHATEAEIDTARRREGRDPAGAKVIVIRGEGGMGKSTLARHAARRFGWRFPAGIQEISLEILPKKEALIGRIGNWLFGEPFKTLADERAREAEVIRAVRESAMLLILDNYETLVQAMQALPTDADARALAQFIAKLAGGKSVLLITSRDSVSGLAGARELVLDGLSDEDGQELFWDFAPNRRREVDESLALQLVAEVGGHPLALELLGSAYADFAGGLPEFLRGLAAQLAHAQDFYKTDRHATLGGCFDYSLRQLPKDAVELFVKLILFQAPFLASQVEFLFEEPSAKSLLHTIHRKCLLRAFAFVEDLQAYYFHPVIKNFASSLVKDNELIKSYGDKYASIFEQVAIRAYNSFAISADPAAVAVARLTLPDIVRTRELLSPEAEIRHSLALTYLLQAFGATSEAESLAEEMNEIAKLNKLDKYLGPIYFEKGRLAQIRGDFQSAEISWQQSRKFMQSFGDTRGEIEALNSLASLSLAQGRHEIALKEYEELLKLRHDAGDLRGKGATLFQIAVIQVIRSQFNEAEGFLKEALAIFDFVNDLLGRCNALRQLSYIERLSGRIDDAHVHLESALLAAQQSGDAKAQTESIHDLAQLFLAQGDIKQAKEMLEECYSTATQMHALQLEAEVLLGLGHIDLLSNDLTKSLEKYERALKISARISDIDGESDALERIADVNFKIGELDASLQAYEASFKIKDGLSDLKGKCDILRGIGNVMVAQRLPLRAQEKYEEALQIAKDIAYVSGQAQCLHELAFVYVTNKDFYQAQNFYAQSIEINVNIGDKRGEAMTRAMRSQVFMELRDNNEALRDLLIAYRIMHDLNDSQKTRKVQELVHTLRNEIGTEEFSVSWKAVVHNAEVPLWLR